jgi:hypothetical protein
MIDFSRLLRMRINEKCHQGITQENAFVNPTGVHNSLQRTLLNDSLSYRIQLNN